jgi:hypothetical protein
MDSFYYGNFLRDEGGQGLGWITYTHHPRFGGNYRGLANRLDLLLESYSYIPYAERVRATYAFLRESLYYVAGHGPEIVALLAQCEMPPDFVAVRYRLEAFPGVEVEVPTREPYTLEGAPVTVRAPWLARFVSEHTVRRPLAYAVPPAVAALLRQHGLQVATPDAPPMLDAEIAVVRGKVSSAGARSSRPMPPNTWKRTIATAGTACRTVGRWHTRSRRAVRSRCTCARRRATTACSPAGWRRRRRRRVSGLARARHRLKKTPRRSGALSPAKPPAGCGFQYWL